MTARKRYRAPLRKRLLNWLRVPAKVGIKLLVPLYAIWGKYPSWMVTPDDPVSPFGSGTTKGASNEPTVRKVYAKFGRYIGDVYWLAWRNSGYGLAYAAKPDWLKRPGLRYMDQRIDDERYPPADGHLDKFGNFVEEAPGEGTLWVRCPDGTWLWETTRRWGPIYLITGYRLSAVCMGALEDWRRIAGGYKPVPRPLHHPNMDGRPIVSLRTKRTM